MAKTFVNFALSLLVRCAPPDKMMPKYVLTSLAILITASYVNASPVNNQKGEDSELGDALQQGAQINTRRQPPPPQPREGEVPQQKGEALPL